MVQRHSPTHQSGVAPLGHHGGTVSGTYRHHRHHFCGTTRTDHRRGGARETTGPVRDVPSHHVSFGEHMMGADRRT